MSRRWVVNASPLILLGKVGQIKSVGRGRAAGDGARRRPRRPILINLEDPELVGMALGEPSGVGAGDDQYADPRWEAAIMKTIRSSSSIS